MNEPRFVTAPQSRTPRQRHHTQATQTTLLPRPSAIPANPSGSRCCFCPPPSQRPPSMAWTRQSGTPEAEEDPVFDEEGDERDLRLLEWRGLMAKREKEGYVAGLEEGKEATLQNGFNLGFGRAVERAFHTWQLSGALRALESWNDQNAGASDTRRELKELQAAFSELGQAMMACVGAECDGTMDTDDLGEALESMDIQSTARDVDCPPVVGSGFANPPWTQGMDAYSEENKNECDPVDLCKSELASVHNCTPNGSVGWNELQIRFQQLRERCEALLGQAGLTRDNIALILCEHIGN
uniref:Protein YAE1 homolog n=1 Tax=Petromyzon marinus TaxID=7757 RepID=A0AAJ7SMF0_PETMA|nr:protein YAE1 homolog [Petromyzon marinus]